MEIEFNPDDILLGIHFMNYEDEFGNEGTLISFGFIIFNINITL